LFTFDYGFLHLSLHVLNNTKKKIYFNRFYLGLQASFDMEGIICIIDYA